MSVPVTFQLASFQQGYCWPGVQQYATDLIAHLTGSIPDIAGVVFGDTDPGADYHNGQWLWIKTNSGFPVGHFLYHGGWLWPHPRPAGSQERILWVGAESDLLTFDGGANVAISDTTGPFWQADHDFDGHFPVGCGTIPGAGLTVVTPGSTGGVDQHTIAETDLPLYNPRVEMFRDDGTTKANLVAVKGTGGTSSAGQGVGAAGNETAPEVQIRNIANSNSYTYGNATPAPLNNLPPYRGLFLIKRTARIYMTG